jgi:RNA 2',3'-cyclic 3'-phosphodiesterase
LGAVAKERLKSPRARLFVALDLPDAVRDGLAQWQARALEDPALRPMRPEALHVTLCFLSYHQEKLIPRITEVVTSVAARPIELRFEPEPSPRPKGRPRLYALGARSEGAVAIQAELSAALEAQHFYKPEKRAFWPHVTVARVRSERLRPGRGERRGRGRPKRVAEPPAPLPEALTEPFGAVRVALYRSNLKPQGAEYVSLAGVDLPSPEG